MSHPNVLLLQVYEFFNKIATVVILFNNVAVSGIIYVLYVVKVPDPVQ